MVRRVHESWERRCGTQANNRSHFRLPNRRNTYRMAVCTPGATRASGDASISWLVCRSTGHTRATSQFCRWWSDGWLRCHQTSEDTRRERQVWAGWSREAPRRRRHGRRRAATREHGYDRDKAWRRRGSADDLQLGRSTNLPTGQNKPALEQVDLKVPKRKLEAGARQPDRFRWPRPKLSRILQIQSPYDPSPFIEFRRRPWAITNELMLPTFSEN